jgi:hypothetical protein
MEEDYNENDSTPKHEKERKSSFLSKKDIDSFIKED